MPNQIAGEWIRDAEDRYGVGPIDEATGDGVGWRAANVASGYGDARVVVYDGGGASAAPVFKNAAALADALANPTVGGVGAFGHGFNGSTWDRLRTGAFTAATTPTGVLPVTNLGLYQATPATYTDGQYGHLQMGSRGSLKVQIQAGDAASTLGVSNFGASDGNSANGVSFFYPLQGFNGATWDRLRSGSGGDGSLTGVLRVVPANANGLNRASPDSAGDGNAGTRLAAGALFGFNGSTYDRLRSGAQADVAAATGFLAALGVAQYNATPPTVTDTRYQHLQVGSRGSLRVEILDASGTNAASVTAAPADAFSNTFAGLRVQNFNQAFNGSTWDRLRTVGGTDAVSPTGYLGVGLMLVGSGGNLTRLQHNATGPTTGSRAAVATGAGVMTSLSAVAATGAGTAFNLGTAHDAWTLQVTHTGGPASVIVTLQVSLDGTSWTTVATWDSATQTNGETVFITGKPATRARANLTTLTGGAAPTVTALLAAA